MLFTTVFWFRTHKFWPLTLPFLHHHCRPTDIAFIDCNEASWTSTSLGFFYSRPVHPVRTQAIHVTNQMINTDSTRSLPRLRFCRAPPLGPSLIYQVSHLRLKKKKKWFVTNVVMKSWPRTWYRLTIHVLRAYRNSATKTHPKKKLATVQKATCWKKYLTDLRIIFFSDGVSPNQKRCSKLVRQVELNTQRQLHVFISLLWVSRLWSQTSGDNNQTSVKLEIFAQNLRQDPPLIWVFGHFWLFLHHEVERHLLYKFH